MRIIFLIVLLFTLNSVAGGSANNFSNEEELYENANPKIIWSEPTNFLTLNRSEELIRAELRAGINVSNGVITLSGNPVKLVHPAEIGFANDTTNFIHATLPRLNKWLSLTMTDANGFPVPKTALGLTLGKSPNLETNVAWWHWGRYGYAASLFSHSVNMYDFDPTKYFTINKRGLYKLTVIQRLYVVGTNAYLTIVTLPPVSVPVRIEK